MEKAKLIFVTGGVRSGKSEAAEQLAIKNAQEKNGRLHYVACGQVTDKEMAERIGHHQKRRNGASEKWTTWEQSANLGALAGKFTKKDVLLIDCLTTLLTNEWFGSSTEEADWENPDFHMKIKKRIETGLQMLCQEASCVVIVSNELSFEPCSTPLVFHYAKLLGELHQQITASADQAILVEYGCKLVKKGSVQ